MKKRKIVAIVFMAICLWSGCASNSTIDVYDSDKKIATVTKSTTWKRRIEHSAY